LTAILQCGLCHPRAVLEKGLEDGEIFLIGDPQGNLILNLLDA